MPASQLREAQQRIRELERLLGRKQMEIEILEAAREVVKKDCGCAKGPGGDRPPRDEDLPDPADGPADGLLPSASPPRGILPVSGRRHGAPADPRRHQQPGPLRVPARVGHGEPDRRRAGGIGCEGEENAFSASLCRPGARPPMVLDHDDGPSPRSCRPPWAAALYCQRLGSRNSNGLIPVA